eukprot:5655465-Pyramimonas_sp.AAC.1
MSRAGEALSPRRSSSAETSAGLSRGERSSPGPISSMISRRARRPHPRPRPSKARAAASRTFPGADGGAGAISIKP